VDRELHQLTKLKKQTDKLSEGNYIHIRPHEFTGEFHNLAISINNLAELVKKHQMDLHIQLLAKTKQFNAQIEELNRTKSIMSSTLLELRKQKELVEQQKDDLLYLSLAIENASDSIIITDPDSKIIYANRAIEDLTGYDRLEIIGQKPSLWGNRMKPEFYKRLWDTIKVQKRMFSDEVENTRKDGTQYSAQLRVSPVLDDKKEVMYFIGLENDVTKEREIDRMKTEFISLASHQLRTPLSAIKWYIEMLLNGDIGKVKPEQKAFIENVNKSNDRMIELVNALLNVSRIESGRLIVDPKPTNIGELIRETLGELKKKIGDKELVLLTDFDVKIPDIKIDPKLIRQVVINLMTNSIKYTPNKGVIEVAVSKNENEVIISVKDSGYGIPKKDHDRVYTRFYRGENIVGRETDGTGLGLYLCKKIVEVSAGKIWFESAEGKGTTFWVALPFSGTPPHKGEVIIDS